MILKLHPITPAQRAHMPRFNNLERIGLSGVFEDIQNFAEKTAEKGKKIYDQVQKDRQEYQNLMNAQQPQPPVAVTDQKKKDTMMLWGSVAALVVAAVVAKKYVFND